MITIKKYIIIILTIFNFVYSYSIKDKCVDIINSYFGSDIELVNEEYIIPYDIKIKIENKIKQKFYRGKIFYWIIKTPDEINYALLDNSIGKTMPITYLVIFNNDLEVINSSIIKYREPYGGEVSGKKWLSQFNGMASESIYKFEKEIDGISGATLSVRSLTKGINKLSLLLPYVIDEYINQNYE
ncbi:MAG: hypothetical protein CMG24_04845 [Candidatus Marinimicrobia bacterium]|nr:hypothetical protein [Candidatus Neomarinimicrobiota bacterium]